MRPAVTAALAVLAGCGRIAFDARDDGANGDGTGDGAASCTAPFTNAQPATWINMPGILDWAPHESADGLTLYFGSQRTGDTELYHCQRATRSDAWGAPTQITELTGAADEEDNPAVRDDELEMYFGRTEVERVERADRTQPWGSRTLAIGGTPSFNSPQGPFLSATGLRLYFTANSSAGYDMYVVARPDRSAVFDPAQAIAMSSLNTPADDGWPYLTDDELTIYFTSASGGDLDIWMATRPNASIEFSPPTPVTIANSPSSEYDPHVSADGQTLWFASNRVGGSFDFDIYFATRSCP